MDTERPVRFAEPSRRRFLAVAGAAIAAPASAQQPSSPAEQAVRGLIEAMAAGDATRIRAAFADDTGQAYGSERYKTPDSFRRWLETDIIQRGGLVENPRYRATGEEVVVTGRYRSRGYESAADFLFEVRDGKVRRWRIRY
jgi:hypothetical protein